MRVKFMPILHGANINSHFLRVQKRTVGEIAKFWEPDVEQLC